MLLVDIGNSRLKWAIADEHGLTENGNYIYHKSDLTGNLDHAWQGISPPDQVWVSNVTKNAIAGQLEHWITEHWKCVTRFASVSPAACGVINAYPDYQRLGIDRWLALIATWHKYKSAACIIDCGTAVTVDGLNIRGEHIGGLILPGISLMQQSLIDATALPDARPVEAFSTLANNTEQAVIAGCRLAVAGLVERVSRDMQNRYDNAIFTILTGGEAEIIGNLLAIDYKYEPHLVLEGLALYAGKYS
jgi:type III pantothenate kinase